MNVKEVEEILTLFNSPKDLKEFKSRTGDKLHTKPFFFVPNTTPRNFEVREFGLEEILRSHKKAFKTKYLDLVMKTVKRVVLNWRYWTEVKVPSLYVYAEKNGLKTKDVESGDWDIFIRLSQDSTCSNNFRFFGSQPCFLTMLRFLLDNGVLFKTSEFEMDKFRFYESSAQKSLGYAKGYLLNIKGLFSYLKAIKEKVIDPLNKKFGVDIVELARGVNDVDALPLEEVCKRAHTLFSIYRKGFGLTFLEGSFTNPSKNTKKLDWREVRKKVRMNKFQAILIEERFFSNAKETLGAIKKMKLKFSPKIVAFLQASAQVEEKLETYNKDKCVEEGFVSPYRYKWKRKFRGTTRDPMLGSLTGRIYGDLCSVKKADPEYKGKRYGGRKDIFRELWGVEEVFEYDTKNSIHADSYGVLALKLFEKDLYSEILPDKLKMSLEGDEGWMELVDIFVLKPNNLSFDEFFKDITIRDSIKKLSNVTFAVSEVAGKVYAHIFRHFTNNLLYSREMKSIARGYAEHFCKVYESVVGPTFGNFVYFIESWRMLEIATKIQAQGYRVALIYDCLVTNKKISDGEWKRLNLDAYKKFREENAQLCGYLIEYIKGGKRSAV